MTTRNFDALFAPKSVALLGASNKARSVGAVLAKNLFEAGFAGPVMTVNPHALSIRSSITYHSVAELPVAPDLAVIATPAATVPGLIGELGARGCRAAIVISTGFAPPLRQTMLDQARPNLLRIVGPNCLGMLSAPVGLNATFAHIGARKGGLAFLTQSGAVATAMLDWAATREIGFSHIVSLGEMADVDFGDMLDYLALDPATSAILLYVESITHPRKFLSAARIAARSKPVIVVKAGRSAAGMAAAASHTGALSGADAVYDAAFRRAGVLRVETLRDLFDAARTLASGVRLHGDRITIVTNGGGLGVLAADALEQLGAHLAPLPEKLKARLDGCLPAAWSGRNPIDLLGDADGERHQRALEAVLEDGAQDAVLQMNCPTGISDSVDAANALLAARTKRSGTPLLGCWMGETSAAAPRSLLAAHGVPSFETPDEAIRAIVQLIDYDKGQRSLLETPTALAERAPDAAERAQRVIAAALAEDRSLLTAPEAQKVLEAFGVPTAPLHVAPTPEDAARIAADIASPVALKVLSRDITHKSDVGGVHLNLNGRAAVLGAAQQIASSMQTLAPKARLDGFTVQPMVRRPDAQELICGLSVDSTFGPVVLFGGGGVAVEVVRDSAIGLPPLNSALALDMISRTRVSALLKGYRDRPPADLHTIAAVLVSLSDLVIACPQIAELDINPLLADANGAIALDARIVVRKQPAGAFSIRPYPAELTQNLPLSTGETILLRPIRPEDEPLLVAMIAQTDPEHLRLRFHGSMRRLSHPLAARLCQIDYDREMALIALTGGAIAGVVRLSFDPNIETGEFAIIVRSDRQGQGLGRELLMRALSYARDRGATSLWGDILLENQNMLTLARRLGAEITPAADRLGLARATFMLASTALPAD